MMDPPADDTTTSASESPALPAAPSEIAHYRILETLGEGGMGVVYAAEDRRLQRKIALKVIRAGSDDPQAARRLTREARLAAQVSHPRICQVYELGEWQGHPFLTMELLAGEPLTKHIARGPLPVHDAVAMTVAVLEALAVLHGHGIIHRDLKPSNVFVTPTGVKLLDFGVARGIGPSGAADTVTQEGWFVGTPRYAAPEQITGAVIDPRADLFAAGVLLFEMLTGRTPFAGTTIPDLLHAVLHAPAPVLTGSPAVSAVDRVLSRALAKAPADRQTSAEAFAAELRTILPLTGDDRAVAARQILRLAVLPFRLLRPDAAIDYLAVSLADALVMALSGLESLVVRSSLQSAKHAGASPDLAAVAADLAVDVVLTGSILHVDQRVRVSAQLVSVPAGDLLWTGTVQATGDDLFELHDDLTRRVVASLPLTAADRARPRAGRPSSTKAYDLYLRGMQLRLETGSWRQARVWFERCLELDPSFAPAWAELGRLNRVLAKYGDDGLFVEAQAALHRALQLDPQNGPAQYYYAQLDIDLGRLDDSLTRLLTGVRQRRAEPQRYAALVHACRYAGLLDASLAAHHQGRRLDPTLTTSVLHTYYMQGDYVRALEEGHAATDPLEARVLGAMGRDRDAIAAARREEQRFSAVPIVHSFAAGLRAALEGRPEDARVALQLLLESGFRDGEGLFYAAGICARTSMLDDASRLLARAIDAGFLCLPAFERDPYLTPLRADGRMAPLLGLVEQRRQSALAAFDQAHGPALLGLPAGAHGDDRW